MNGSEKQIKWANEIVEQTKALMSSNLDKATDRHAHLSEKPELKEREDAILAGRTVVANLVLSKLNGLNDAKYIIDNRNNLHIKILQDNMRNLPQTDVEALKAVAQYVDRNQFYGFIFGY